MEYFELRNGTRIPAIGCGTVTFGREGGKIYAEVTSDGGSAVTLETGDRITITKSPYNVKLVKINETSFLQTLNKKMFDTGI